VNIKTNFDYPPIPTRNMDWSAIDDDTYDASYEGEDESGSVWKCSPSGHGATELEAVKDLLSQLDLTDAMAVQLLAEFLAKPADYYSLPLGQQSALQSLAAKEIT
jgi:hypothetical protein